MIVRRNFRTELQRVTELSYLLGSGCALVVQEPPDATAAGVRERLQSLCTDGRPITRAGLRRSQIRPRRKELPSFVADLLLVHLAAFSHVRLALACGCAPDAEAPATETLLGKRPGTLPDWCRRDIVLLAEVRNSIVHGDGTVSPKNPRLAAAGWDPDMLATDGALSSRSFNHVLRFKRAVRTAGNALSL